mmetsp:Transcript_2825/g.6639  ORF Transcript_2825/g.6639 Transcript_2825/m.6639 type:complete len:405 (-) Transcript_2825:965-2179(-)
MMFQQSNLSTKPLRCQPSSQPVQAQFPAVLFSSPHHQSIWTFPCHRMTKIKLFPSPGWKLQASATPLVTLISVLPKQIQQTLALTTPRLPKQRPQLPLRIRLPRNKLPLMRRPPRRLPKRKQRTKLQPRRQRRRLAARQKRRSKRLLLSAPRPKRNRKPLRKPQQCPSWTCRCLTSRPLTLRFLISRHLTSRSPTSRLLSSICQSSICQRWTCRRWTCQRLTHLRRLRRNSRLRTLRFQNFPHPNSRHLVLIFQRLIFQRSRHQRSPYQRHPAFPVLNPTTSQPTLQQKISIRKRIETNGQLRPNLYTRMPIRLQRKLKLRPVNSETLQTQRKNLPRLLRTKLARLDWGERSFVSVHSPRDTRGRNDQKLYSLVMFTRLYKIHLLQLVLTPNITAPLQRSAQSW